MASGGGARRRNGAGPERGRGGAHGEEEEAASLTGGLDAGSDGEAAARQAEAASGEGARWRPCREGEGAGLGAKPSEGWEEMLLAQGIEPRLTGAAESRRRAATGARAGGVNGEGEG